jgi:uncharacterized protein YbbC (DUF1343 family)
MRVLSLSARRIRAFGRVAGWIVCGALVLAACAVTLETSVTSERGDPVRSGLDVLADGAFAPLAGRRVALVTNATGVDRSLRSGVDALASAQGVELRVIFSPEHGVRGESEAGSHVGDGRDERTGIPIHSLYGATRRPTCESFLGADVVLFDIQDVGVRTYTYASTLVEVLWAAAACGIEVWVLDRPVPIGADIVEGPVLEPARRSFVGAHTVALRHGLTMGEFARLVDVEAGIGANPRVIELEGYRRSMTFEETGLVWVPPSPNIPTVETALVYTGTVLIEGTNLSEGRGTTRPFHRVGAPWLDARAVVDSLGAAGLPGALFRAIAFTPTFSKFRGESCSGVEIHVTDRRAYRPVATAVALIAAVRALHPDRLELDASTFDRLAGTSTLREAILRGESYERIEEGWEATLDEYLERRERVLIYDP